MKNHMLLSSGWRWLGLASLILGAVPGLATFYGEWKLEFLDYKFGDTGLFSSSNHNFTDEVALSFVIIGLMLLCFSKVKKEDEYVFRNRLLSWQWSVLINYILLFVATWTLYDFDFLNVMLYGMLSIPLIFLIRFYFVLFQMGSHAE